MPISRWLRRHSAVYALPMLYPLTYLVLRGNFSASDRGWDGAAAGAAGAIIVIAPLGAALAAWEGYRLREGGIFHGAHTRTRLMVAASFLWPIFVACGSALALAAVLAWIDTSPSPGRWNVLIFLAPITVMTAFVALGFTLGNRLRPVWTVPLLLVGGWLALAYPVAIEPLWLRHLTGALAQTCCTAGETANPRIILAPVAVATGLIGAAILLLPWTRMKHLRILLAVSLMAGGLSSGVLVVKDLGWNGGLVRADGLVCERESDIDICLWQEHDRYRSVVSGALVAAVRRLGAAGLPTPHTITEGKVSDGRAWSVRATRWSTSADAVMSMVSGLIPPEPDCSKGGEWLGEDAVNSVGAWAALTAGVPAELIAGRLSEEALGTARKVVTAPRKAQLAWFNRALQAIARCDVQPPRVPAR